MWSVYESKKARKNIDRLPGHISERYDFWKNVVINSAPVGLVQHAGFKDHALTGQWKGYRSSRLNDQFRVIYKIESEEVYVAVEDVTAHDYRRK